MILRRVISHVKNQEWTAIAIDFLIVVFGVFAGFQVNNWNAARQDRARGSQYNWYERRRAAFDEIVASGSLGLISDVGLRETAIGIYNTPIFSIALSEGQSSRYRDLFRMSIEPSLHNDLSKNCGDKEYDSGGAAVGLLTMDYPCTLTASPDEMAEGVLALRSDPEVARALKLRNAQVSGRTYDLEATIRTFGLKKLFEEDITP